MKKRIAVKVGTSTLTEGSKSISRKKIEDIASQLKELQSDYDILFISSGAVAAARDFDKIDGSTANIENKSALSAIGQPLLMQLYMEVFQATGLKTAQCLVTHYDFEKESSRENTENTLSSLLKHGYIPIINENDTVAVEEIIVGDNDKLSALVADLMDVETLIIASDIDGIFDSNPHMNPDAKLIENVSNLEDIQQFVQEKDNGLGTGGMTSKINAMKICSKKNIEVLIINGGVQFFIKKALNKEISFTRFKAK